MNLKRIGLSAAAVFAAMFAVEMLTHEVLLKGLYLQTASVWRPAEQMEGFMGCLMLSYLFYSVFFPVIYAKGYESGKPGVGQGIRFGILMGLLEAPMGALTWYSVLPIPAALALGWLAGGLVLNVVLGVVVGLIYRP